MAFRNPFRKKSSEKKAAGGGQKAGNEDFVGKAYTLFEEFREAYKSEWARLEENERLYLGRHWEDMNDRGSREDDPKPVTPVINSTVENLQADLLDRYPQAVIRPENPADRVVADIVGALIKQNHDAMSYREEYAKLAHDLLVGGYCVQQTGYDPLAARNLGSAFIRYVDNHGIMVDPQVTDIQDGRAVFKFAPKPIKWLEQRYPDKEGKFQTDEYDMATDQDIQYDKTKSVLMLEYWWREFDTKESCWRVHMALIAGRQLLEDSRDAKPEGYFSLGEYPFVLTPYLRRKTSALGYGIPDLFGTQQKYADKLDQIALKNAAMASHMKLMVTDGSGFDVDDLRDWSKEVHQGISLNGVSWFETPPLPAYIVQEPSVIRQNIKEESGANDFSRGNTSSGVTAASAIAALQEASSKRSRALVNLMHEGFKKAVRYEIEFEREYNTLPREVLLTVDGEQQVSTFESALMERETELGNKVPVEFMISIKVEQENRWSTMAQNELVLQMVQLGVIQPGQAVELMEFEGKELVLGQMRNNKQPSPEQQAQEQAGQEQAALEGMLEQMPMPEMEQVVPS